MWSSTGQAQGMVGSHHAAFIPTHRDGNDTPVVMQVSMSVPVSLEDIEAVLWIAVTGGFTFGEDEFGDDAAAHGLVLETLLHEGTDRIGDARLAIADIRPGDSEWALLKLVRQRVRELYGRPGVPAPRHELAGV